MAWTDSREHPHGSVEYSGREVGNVPPIDIEPGYYAGNVNGSDLIGRKAGDRTDKAPERARRCRPCKCAIKTDR